MNDQFHLQIILHYCWLGSVETSSPGGIKMTSFHSDVEFSCKIILLLVSIYRIDSLHIKGIDIAKINPSPKK